MSNIEEDLRKLMNITPFADPFEETFDPTTDSLEAIRGAIDALEAGIFAYGLDSGPQEVEIDDKGKFVVELFNPGGTVIPAASITPGTCTITRIRDGTQAVQYGPVAAKALDGLVVVDTVDYKYEFLAANWAPGDLYMVVFSGVETDIGGTVTHFPDFHLTGRVVRDEEIENILEYTTVNTLKNAIEDDGDSIYNRLGDPTGETLTSLTAKFGDPTLSFKDHIEVSATEELKDFIAKTGGTEVGAAKSILDALGHTGLADLDTGLMGQLQDYVVDDADSIYNRLGAAHGAALGSLFGILGDPTLSFKDHIEVSATEELKDFIAKTGGTEVGAAKSILDALGHTGLADLDTGLMGQLQDYVVDDADSIYNRLGAAHGATLGSLYGILGDPVQSFKDHIEVSNIEKLKDFIAKTGGTEIPAGDSLYDAIGLVRARTNDPSIMDMLGLPDAANGSLYERLGAFTNANNLRALLGLGFTPTDNLFDILGGYITTDTLKDHVDPIKNADITLITLVTRSMADYIRGIGINISPDGFDSSAVTANEDGSIFERLEHLKTILDDNIADATHTITPAHAAVEQSITTFKAHRSGELAVEFDLNTLVAATPADDGKIVTVRLKHMIDNTTRRTIDLATFVVGTDEIHPTLAGWVDAANANGVEITVQMSAAVAANRVVPYKILEAC